MKEFDFRYQADDDEVDELEIIRTKLRKEGIDMSLEEIFRMALAIGIERHINSNLILMQRDINVIKKNRGIPV